MIQYVLIWLFSVLLEMFAIISVDSVTGRALALTVLCAVLIPGLYYVNNVFVISDHYSIIPALVGHAIGALGTILYLRRRDESRRARPRPA